MDVKREMAAGQERAVWNPTLSVAARKFEFSDPEVARLKAAIHTQDSYSVNAGRHWLQQILSALFGPDLNR